MNINKEFIGLWLIIAMVVLIMSALAYLISPMLGKGILELYGVGILIGVGMILIGMIKK